MISPVFAKLAALEDLTENDRARVDALMTDVRSVARRRDIVSDRARPHHVNLIVDGWAARCKVTRDGRRRITAFLLPGDFCDLHVTTLAAMDHAIVAVTDCRVAYVDQTLIDDITRSTPVLTRALWRSTLVDESILRQWLVNGSRTAYDVIAHLICELHVRMTLIGLADEGRFALPLTQEELADATGMTTVHVNRTLQQLRAAGLIDLTKTALFIPDVAALEHACGFDHSYLHLRSRGASLPR